MLLRSKCHNINQLGLVMLTYQKYFVLLLACVLPCAGFSQGLVKGAQAAARKSAQNALEQAARTAPRAKLLAPLDNGRIEALARRGKEKMIIQRALAVAAQNNSPLVRVIGPDGVNKPLLNALWKETNSTMQKWDAQSTVGLNAWLMVLFSKLQNHLSLSRTNVQVLASELALAQEQAENTFRAQNPEIVINRTGQPLEVYASYREMLAEAVAQRLTDHFLPLLNSVDRMRFLKILMQGRFEEAVRPVELNLAVLEKDVKVGLQYLGPIMKDITAYGKIKNNLTECASRAAEEAAGNNINGLLNLRSLMVAQMEKFTKFFPAQSQAQQDWKHLIEFYKNGAHMPDYPPSLFLH